MTFELLSFGEAAEEAMDSAISKCQVPNEPIGLQAHGKLLRYIIHDFHLGRISS